MEQTPTYRYKAFISYSHAADGKLAPALQSGLERFAKPWYRRRALRVFRDQTGLAVTPELWGSIRRALERSEYFVLLASPAAAESRWVQQEVEFWLQHRSVATLLVVLTDGNLVWDTSRGDFDWSRTDALPRLLERRFGGEPNFLDLRWARSDTDLSVRRPRFLDAVAGIAATLRNVPLDDLIGEDVAHHRTTRRFLRGAVAALAALTVAALYAAYLANEARTLALRLEADRVSKIVAEQQAAAEQARQREAEQRAAAQRELDAAASRELAAVAARVLPQDRELSLLLAIEAAVLSATIEAADALRQPLVRPTPPVSLRVPGALAVKDMMFSPDGQRVLGVADDGSVAIWAMAPPAEPVILKRGDVLGPLDDGARASFSPDGSAVVTTPYRLIRTFLEPEGERAAARIWDAGTGRLRQELRHPYVRHAAFSPDGTRLVTVSDDRTVLVWDAGTGTRLAELKDHDDKVIHVEFSKDGKWLLTAGKFGDVRIRAMPGGQSAAVLRVPDRQLFAAGLSPDGRWVLTLGDDNVPRLWDWRYATGGSAAELHGHARAVRAAEFSPDSELVVTASADTARVWHVPTGRGLRVLDGHDDIVTAATFSPDGRWIVTAGIDGRTVVWHASTGKRLMELAPSSSPCTAAAFSPDGARIATGTSDGRVLVHACDVCGGVPELLAIARSRVSRSLTAAERAEYLEPQASRRSSR